MSHYEISLGTSLECRACVRIARGSPITTHYTSPLLDTNTRRTRLREKWFFDCGCERCGDSAELGAMTSAVRCLHCVQGFSLPSTDEYKCNHCNNITPAQQVEMMIKMWEPIIQAMTSFQSCGVEEKLGLISQLETSFHPHHSVVLELKLSVVNKLCRDDQGRLVTTDHDQLQQKQDLCQDLLSVLNIVYPGRSKYRGLILHELSEACLTRSSQLFNTGEISRDMFHADLIKMINWLGDGSECLQHDRANSMEREVFDNLVKMKKTCEEFVDFINYL